MSLQRILAGLGLVTLGAMTGFLLLVLVRQADAAYAARRAPPPDAKPAAWTQTVRFDQGAAPKAWLAEGWFAPEPGSGVWSVGRGAVLRLWTPPVPGPAEVELALEGFVAPGRPFQRVAIHSGERTLGEWRLTGDAVTTLRFRVPAEERGPTGGLVLRFELPDADAPARLVAGAEDTRLLAIKLHSLEVSGE